MRELKICALIPVWNESERIASVVRGSRERVEAVVVVDDGSTDGTADVAERAGAACLRLPRHQGKGAAVRAGLAYILERDFTHVLFLDGDGQHKPEDIPKLIETASAGGAGMVIGARPFDRSSMPLARYCSNRFGSLIASWLAGATIRDSQSGFRLIRTDSLRPLRLRARKYEIEMEILIKLRRAGCRVEHAPIEMIYERGRARSKMKPVRDTIRICLWSLAFRWGK